MPNIDSVNISLPSLLDEVFAKFSPKASKENIGELLVELDALLSSRVVQAALQLLDYQNIVIYHNTSKTQQIAEINEGYRHGTLKLVRLFPRINYCTCDNFQQQVVGNQTNPSKAPYTCEHVLALRLAVLLESDKLRYEELPAHKLKTRNNSSLFVARLDQIKTFTAGIKALLFAEHGAFMINEDGFTCTVEQGKCIQASLFMMPACFSEFYVDGVVHFNVNMNVLNECLSIFAGIDCTMKMLYKGPEAPLILVLEPQDECEISTECSIKTTAQEEPMEYSLDDNSSSLNVIFIRGPDLSNIFQEFDKSTEELEITISPRRPHFKIDTLGVMQSESSIEVAKSSDMILMFNCRETTKARYKSSLVRMTQKALSVASKVAIKTDLSGLMEMHFMLQDDSQAEVYIQFFITPLAEMD